MNPAKVRYARTTSTPLRLSFRAKRLAAWVEQDPFRAGNVVLYTATVLVAIAVVIGPRLGWMQR